MCYPIEVQRAATNVEVTRFSKKWSPIQIVKSINKSLIRQEDIVFIDIYIIYLMIILNIIYIFHILGVINSAIAVILAKLI